MNRDDLINPVAQHIEWVCYLTTVRTDYTYRRIAFTAMMSWYHRSFNLRMLVWYLLYIFYQPENSLLLTSISYIACADNKEVKDNKFILWHSFPNDFYFQAVRSYLPAVTVFFRGIDSYDFAGNSESWKEWNMTHALPFFILVNTLL